MAGLEPTVYRCGVCGKKSVFWAYKCRLSLKPGLSREEAIRKGGLVEEFHIPNEPTMTEIQKPDERHQCPYCGADGTNLSFVRYCAFGRLGDIDTIASTMRTVVNPAVFW